MEIRLIDIFILGSSLLTIIGALCTVISVIDPTFGSFGLQMFLMGSGVSLIFMLIDLLVIETKFTKYK